MHSLGSNDDRASAIQMKPRAVVALALWAVCQPLCGCRNESVRATDAQGERAIPVGLTSVQRGEVALPVRGFGRLEPQRSLDLSFKLGGVLARVLVDEGAVVKKGQVLATLDATEYDAQQRQARQALHKADRDRQRLSELVQDGAAAKVSADDAQSAYVSARAALDVATFNLRQSQLVAPEDACVAARLADPGEIVTPGRAVLQLSSTGQAPRMSLEVSDRDVLGVQLGAAASITFDAADAPPMAAHVSRIARAASQATGTFNIELTLDDPAAAKLPFGLTCKAEIARTRAHAVSVPLAALVDSNGRSAAVYVVEDEHAKRVPVRIEQLFGDRALLETPLLGVEQVVDRGVYLLRDGVRTRM